MFTNAEVGRDESRAQRRIRLRFSRGSAPTQTTVNWLR